MADWVTGVDDLLRQGAEGSVDRLEQHLIGAWYAGYDYVHVHEPVTAQSETGGDGTVVEPSNDAEPSPPEGYSHRHTYDIASVDERAIRLILEGDA